MVNLALVEPELMAKPAHPANTIPVFRPSITEEEIRAVAEVMRSGWLGLGPVTEEFENALAAEFEAGHVIALNSGTAALHLAVLLLDLKPDDEVIVPTITFVSTAHAVRYAGAKVVFADVDKDTLCISVEDVRRKITDKTRAIIPVHYGGHPCDMDALRELAERKQITLIEDAAHACGASYKGKAIGAISPLTCFSFHAVKNLTCGEGGAVFTHNAEWARILREMRWMGISKDTYARTSNGEVYAWQYWVDALGFKYHMHDIAAAIGLVQLRRLKENNRKRRRIMELYNRAFAGHPWIETPVEYPHVRSSWHIYPIKISRRDELIAHLKRGGIAPGVHYYPIHLHPYYAAQESHCPIAEEVWKKVLSLPMFPDMSDAELSRVIEAVLSFEP